MGMAAAVFAVVTPAWRLYILKIVKTLPKTSACSCGAFISGGARFCGTCGARRDEDLLLENHFRGGHSRQQTKKELTPIHEALEAISPRAASTSRASPRPKRERKPVQTA